MKRIARRLLRQVGLNRSDLASVRMCCERNVLARVARIGKRPARRGGRILCYHSVGQPDWGVNDVRPDQFRSHLELAVNAGYRIVPAAEIARTGGGPKDLAITFDDGLKSVLTEAAPILAEFGAPWSVYIVSDWADGRHGWAADTMLRWDEIERLAANGVEIGSHSVTHPNFSYLTPSEVQDQLARSRHTIEQRIGIVPDSFAIPLGQSENWSPGYTTAAHDAGYATVYAQAEETRPYGTIPRTFVTRWDTDLVFAAALDGAFDRWEEWV